MTIDEAFRGALKYETNVRDIYRDAAKGSRKPESRALYETLYREEQSHVDYLGRALSRWEHEGRIGAEGPETAFPSLDEIRNVLARVESQNRNPDAEADLGGETEALSRALAAEEKTSEYYRKMASELTSDARKVFERFVEIEEGHTSIVRAQLDLVTRTGYWFDVREFDQED